MAKKKTSKIGFDPLAWMKNSRESRVLSLESKTPSRESGVLSRESKDIDSKPGAAHQMTETSADAGFLTPDSRLQTPDSPSVRIDCADRLTLPRVGALHGSLIAALESHKVVELDLARVESVDVAGLQLLVALRREAQRRNVALRLKSPSAAVREGATLAGLAGALGLSV